jgi:SnoaL-like domain
MAQATSELVHRFFRALDERDQAALLDLVHPDVEFTSLIQEAEGRFCGHVGLRQYWRELFAAFAEWKVWVEEIPRARVRRRRKGSRARHEFRWWGSERLHRLASDRATRWTRFRVGVLPNGS